MFKFLRYLIPSFLQKDSGTLSPEEWLEIPQVQKELGILKRLGGRVGVLNGRIVLSAGIIPMDVVCVLRARLEALDIPGAPEITVTEA